MLGRHVFGGVRRAAVTDATRVVRHDGVVAGERTGEAAAQPVQAVIAAADKAEQRRWADAAVAQPAFRIVPAGASEGSLRRAAAEAGFPARSRRYRSAPARDAPCPRPGRSGDGAPADPADPCHSPAARPRAAARGGAPGWCARTGPLSRVLHRLTDPLPAE